MSRTQGMTKLGDKEGTPLPQKGDVLLEFSSVKWVLNDDHTLYCNILGTLLLQNFVLVNSYFNEFFVAQTTVYIKNRLSYKKNNKIRIDKRKILQ